MKIIAAFLLFFTLSTQALADDNFHKFQDISAAFTNFVNTLDTDNLNMDEYAVLNQLHYAIEEMDVAGTQQANIDVEYTFFFESNSKEGQAYINLDFYIDRL